MLFAGLAQLISRSLIRGAREQVGEAGNFLSSVSLEVKGIKSEVVLVEVLVVTVLVTMVVSVALLEVMVCNAYNYSYGYKGAPGTYGDKIHKGNIPTTISMALE